MTKTFHLKKLALCVALPLAVGFASSLLAPNTKEVYAEIIKPPLSPPPWVFPVAWTILYVLMGIAFCIIKDSDSKNKNKALRLFYLQLALNFLWTPVFFTLQLYWVAMVILLLLWAVVLLTTFRFRLIDATAGNLLIPYLLWLSFAAYLNMGVACLN